MSRRQTIRSLAGSAFAFGLLAITLPGSARAVSFEPQPLSIHSLKLFDLGIADVDGVQGLDVITVNHSYRSSVLLNDGAAGFDDSLYDLGLGQDSQFPGLESQSAPSLAEPGVYVFFDGRRLRLVGHDLEQPESLRVRLLSPADVVERSGAQVRLVNREHRSRGRVTIGDGGEVALLPELVALPVEVELLGGLAPSETYVGNQAVTPGGPEFELTLRDRHAIAWADLDDDGDTDGFIARGGLRGQLDRYDDRVRDELMLVEGGGFADAYEDSGLTKGRCRARSAAAGDFDGDGSVDLFAGCEDTPPRLHPGVGDATFGNASAALRAAGAGPGAARWFDLDGDIDPELLIASPGALEVFRRDGQGWTRAQRLQTRNERPATAIAPADFDADGDPDALLVAPDGNTLLINGGGLLDAANPATVGLPAGAGLDVAWTDFDNDGDVDADIPPRGLFSQGGDGSFTPVAGPATGPSPRAAVSAWPDLDTDGDRDPLLAWRPRGRPDWKHSLHLSQGVAGNWLELEPATAGATALGARIEATAGGSTQTGWIGQSETSLRSQGHYRVYFGLGTATEAEVAITWRDGTSDDLGTVAANQLLVVAP